MEESLGRHKKRRKEVPTLIAQIAFRSGEVVPDRLGGVWIDGRSHTATLDAGDVFPPCKRCGNTVWHRFR